MDLANTCLHVLVMQTQAKCKAAAVKIAAWYKRCVETRPARLTLKAHRQLLPLTSLDLRKEEEEKVAAATAILVLLKDIQRGHHFAIAVKAFLSKVKSTTSGIRLLRSVDGFPPVDNLSQDFVPGCLSRADILNEVMQQCI